MPKINVNITEDNITEWVHSIGYFLPRNNKEEARFEKLHSEISYNIDVNAVDPFAILNGRWQPRFITLLENSELEEEVSQLRMAARKHEDLPDEIIRKIKMNQKDHDSSDNTKD
jgi:hypothetical protein